MNLEERLTNTFNEVLRTSGYIFEIINNNKRQSNLITGPNNQLISASVTNHLAQSIAQFDLILDETVSRSNDARWCVEQIVENRQKQEELKAQEERKKKEEEETAARKKKEEGNRLLDQNRAKELEKDARETETEENVEKERNGKKQRDGSINSANGSSETQNHSASNNNPSIMDSAFELDMDLGKDQDLLNPSDILSTINYKGAPSNADENKLGGRLDNMELDFEDMLNNGQSVLENLDVDLLDQDLDMGDGMEEEFDVDTFLNQICDGD